MKGALPRVAAFAACCAGALGLGRLLVTLMATSDLPNAALVVLAAPTVLLLCAAIAVAVAPSTAPRTPRWWLLQAPLAAWPTLLPLAPLVAWGAGSTHDTLLPGAPLLISVLVFSFAHRWVQPLAPRREPGKIALHDLALLAFTLSAAVLFIFTATRSHVIGDNDGAYYFGLSRYIATTGRFEEPLVWHFLNVPEKLIHPPFDYWAPMTVAVLTPPMAIFGATNTVAAVAMAVVSGFSLVAFWYLVCVALPLKHFGARLLAILLFAYSWPMGFWRHQPESIVLVQLFTILALICYCRGWFARAAACGACIFFSRTDGLMLFGLIVLVSLHGAFKAGGYVPARRVFRTVAAIVLGYVAWSLLAFGSPTPPGPSKLVFLPSYFNVYTWGMKHERSIGAVLAKFDWGYFAARVELAVRSMRDTGFMPAQDLWMLLAALWGVPFLRGRRAQEAVVWLLFFVGFGLHVWLSGESFAPWRAPFGYLPLFVLAGALGADEIFEQVAGWAKRDHGRIVGIFAAACVTFGLVFGFAARQRYPVPGWWLHRIEQQKFNEDMAPLIGGAVVASNAPWWALAYTYAPVVSLPFNGEQAIEEVFAKYGVQYVLLWGKPAADVQSPSAEVLQRITATDHATLGRYSIDRVKEVNNGQLLRVTLTP